MADRLHHPVKSRAMFLARALTVLLTLPLALASVLSAQSTKDEPKPAKPSGSAQLRIELTGGDTKDDAVCQNSGHASPCSTMKPIADASVYLKFTEGKVLRDKPIELNLKTNQNGVARSPQIPKTRVLIQIVAPGWKTFGQYYDIDQDEQTIQINLERPSNSWLRP